MKQIIVNVSCLSTEEKQRVNEALAKIASIKPCRVPQWIEICSMYTQSSSLWHHVGWNSLEARDSTHTPQQVLEMAGMAKQGHPHAHLMALYAEDAKTTDKPWLLWQVKDKDGVWWECKSNPLWDGDTEYRRKPKTKLIHGVEVPDISFTPNDGEEYVYPNIYGENYASASRFYSGYDASEMALKAGCCYPYTEEGTQAAILHAKAWLGIA